MRNWPKTVPGASWRGFSFQVEREGVAAGGRFVAVHPFAKGETHATEDTGRKPRRFTVTAYLVGDDCDARADALVELCSTAGSGLLVLPMTRPVEVRCLEVRTANVRTEQGKVALDLDFIEAGANGGGGLPALPVGDRLAQGALDGLADMVGDALDALPLPF